MSIHKASRIDTRLAAARVSRLGFSVRVRVSLILGGEWHSASAA